MNENKTERRRIENAEPDEVRAMLSAMESGGYTRKKFTPTSFVSHLEIYQYLSPSGVKFAIVYDTKAKIISVDGRSDAMPALFALFPPRGKPAEERSARRTPRAARRNAQGAYVRGKARPRPSGGKGGKARVGEGRRRQTACGGKGGKAGQ